MLKKTIKTISFIIGLVIAQIGWAQSLTFKDTYPVSDSDSLFVWLKAHPTPSVERLKKLIQLERSNNWYNEYLFGNAFNEIRQLSNILNNSFGQAALEYLEAAYYLKKQKLSEAINHAQKAQKYFQTQTDKSGLINTYALFVEMQFGSEGMDLLKTNENIDCLSLIQNLSSQNLDAHDRLIVETIQVHKYAKEYDIQDSKQLRAIVLKGLEYIKQQPSCQYAQFYLENWLIKSYKSENNYTKVYDLSKRSLASLKYKHLIEGSYMYDYILRACLYLHKVNDGIAISQERLKVLQDNKVTEPLALMDAYDTYRDLATIHGDNALANRLADSLNKYNHLYQDKMNAERLDNMRQKYDEEFQQQRKLAAIQQQTEIAENQNVFMRIILVLSLLFIGILAFLWSRLRKANSQLQSHIKVREHFFAIIAHDLRRPFYAFQEISNLVNYYLKKGDYNALKNISESIDESGLKIRQLLDNLLKWALSQKEEIPYQPEQLNFLSEINEVVSFFQTVYLHRQIDFKIDCPTSLSIKVDKNGLEMILRNIISNALTAIDKDTGTIEVIAEQKSKKTVHLTIRDNGRGLDTRKVNALRQVIVNPNIGDVGQNGFGFGLILIAKFAKRNGITVDLESRVSEGTKFVLIIPTS